MLGQLVSNYMVRIYVGGKEFLREFHPHYSNMRRRRPAAREKIANILKNYVCFIHNLQFRGNVSTQSVKVVNLV